MCLAIPGKVVQIDEADGLKMARVDFGGVQRRACLDYVPTTQIGDYVLVHVGFAISKIDEAEALRTYEYLAELGQLADELGSEQ
jgi:hydrogenase expression/formation protein HypC